MAPDVAAYVTCSEHVTPGAAQLARGGVTQRAPEAPVAGPVSREGGVAAITLAVTGEEER